MGSIVPELLEAFAGQGIAIRVGDSESRTQDPDAQFAKAFRADGSPLSSGAGIALMEVMILEHLVQDLGGNCLVVGNGFGWSAVALGLMLRGRGRVLAMDACVEGHEGALGLKLVNDIAAGHGLPKEGVVGVSPRDLPRLVEDRFQGRLDIVLVDSLHTDEQQLLDYDGIRPFLAAGAVVVFHDVLNWRMEKSFEEIARRDARRSALLRRTPSGIGVLYPKGSALEAFLEAFRGGPAPASGDPAGLWEARYAGLAALYAGRGETGTGDKYLAAALAESSQPERVWAAMAARHFERGAHEDCRACARRALEFRPGWARPVHLEALAARALGSPLDEVGRLMALALAAEEPSPELKLDAGFVFWRMGRTEEAARLAWEALDERPRWGRPYHLQARVARSRGASAGEIWGLMAAAMGGEDLTPEIKVDVAAAALNTGRWELADRLAMEVALDRPEWPVPLHLRALVARESGAPAEEVWRRMSEVLLLGHESPEFKFDAATAAKAVGRLDEAEALAREAAELAPNWPAPADFVSALTRAKAAPDPLS